MSDRLERVRALAALGMSAGEIGRETGSTRNAIAGLCHRNGIRLKGAPQKGAGYRGLPRPGLRSRFSDDWLKDQSDA